jgi:hypothetical protein
MPLHDWTQVDAGLFHAFHLQWIAALTNALNAGVLPADYYALAEQKAGGYAPDVLALKLAAENDDSIQGGLAVASAPPRTAIVSCVEEDIYARKANRIAIHHRHGDVVAVVEIVSPGNKSGKASFNSFVSKSVEFIQQGIHLLLIDVFPPTPRDPLGIHKPIWDAFRDEPFTFPPGKNRLLASYDAGPPWVAYVEPIQTGEEIPSMPLFLRPDIYIPAPLEASYQSSWKTFPKALKGLLEPGST